MIKRNNKINRKKRCGPRMFKNVRGLKIDPFGVQKCPVAEAVSSTVGDFMIIDNGIFIVSSKSALGEIVNEQKTYFRNSNNRLKKRLEELRQVN